MQLTTLLLAQNVIHYEVKDGLEKLKKNAHMYFYIEETIKTFQISRFQVLVKVEIFLETFLTGLHKKGKFQNIMKVKGDIVLLLEKYQRISFLNRG